MCGENDTGGSSGAQQSRAATLSERLSGVQDAQSSAAAPSGVAASVSAAQREARAGGKGAFKALSAIGVTNPLMKAATSLIGGLIDADANPLGAPAKSQGGRGEIRSKGILSAGAPSPSTAPASTPAADPAAAATEDTRRKAKGGRRSTILAGRSIAEEARKTLLGQ